MISSGKHLSDHKKVSLQHAAGILQPACNDLWSIRLILILCAMLGWLGCCTYAEDQFEDSTQANARVLAAYAYKDNACGTSHQLTIPILSNARSEDIDVCVTQILSTDCANWSSENNIPVACLAISIQI